MSQILKDKVVLITGASAGIGEALARAYHAQGARVSGLARRTQNLQALSDELPGFISFPGDVTKSSDLQRWREHVLQKWGRIDIVIANAGFSVSGPFMELQDSDFRRQFEVNVYGVQNCARIFYSDLKATQGNFAIIGSVNSYVALANSSPYAMSKFAIRAFAEALYHEWKLDGVAVTLVCPGFVESEIRRVDNQGQLHREVSDPVPSILLMSKEKAAQKILRAVCRRKRELYLTIHGRIGIYFSRFFPCLFHFVLDFFNIRAGKQKAVR